MFKIDNYEYEVIMNYKDGFNKDEVLNRITDYFYAYDYIVGDWAYGKLRLKGFYESSNKKSSDINDIKYVDNYIKNNCAYDCKYFILKKCKE